MPEQKLRHDLCITEHHINIEGVAASAEENGSDCVQESVFMIVCLFWYAPLKCLCISCYGDFILSSHRPGGSFPYVIQLSFLFALPVKVGAVQNGKAFPFPKSARFSEKNYVFFFPFRQCYVCGKKKDVFLRKAALLSGTQTKGEIGMKSNNQINVPQAREAMDKFKMQAASDEDVLATS